VTRGTHSHLRVERVQDLGVAEYGAGGDPGVEERVTYRVNGLCTCALLSDVKRLVITADLVADPTHGSCGSIGQAGSKACLVRRAKIS